MKVSVIIVSYNCKAFLDYCIQSVIKALNNIDGEIIVFDNSSLDGTVEFIESKNYNLRLIKSENNIGFSKANNNAAKFAKGEFLFFLNPDTIIPEDIFHQFFKFKLDDLGIFGFRMIDGKGNFLKESKRNLPNIKIILKKLLGFDGKYYSSLGELDSGSVDVLCGANMIIKNSIYKKVGGFNEEYFMFGEDIEICYETKKIGMNNFYSATSTLVHFKGESTKNDINYLRNFYGAMRIYFKNIFSSNQFLLTTILLISKFLVLFKSIMPKKQIVEIKTEKNILIGDKPINKLNDLFGEISLVNEIDSSQDQCNVIFDSNYLSFKQIISHIDNLQNGKKIKFWFLPEDYSYVIGSSGMNQKGNIIFFD